jgi:hypothetical protein
MAYKVNYAKVCNETIDPSIGTALISRQENDPKAVERVGSFGKRKLLSLACPV